MSARRWPLAPLALAAALWAMPAAGADAPEAAPQTVQFPGPSGTLGGELYRPAGPGPFPALLYNHGSAPGLLSSQASALIGPLFARAGWLFFMPYRRGQGLSAAAGPAIGDEIAHARRQGGLAAASATAARLLSQDHLQDQLAGLAWLRAQPEVDTRRIATAGNSFGGIEAVLGATQADYCATVDAAGAANSWADSPDIQALMHDAVQGSRSPLFLFQAANDFDLTPSRVLFQQAQASGRPVAMKIYPAHGHNAQMGHAFAYEGAATWFPDVLAFVQRHCQLGRTGPASGAAP